MKKLNKKGFTLLELLAVLVILAALATIAIPIFTNKGATARLAAHIENIRVINDAAQRYEWEKGKPVATDTTYYTNITTDHVLVKEGYLASVPANPYEQIKLSDGQASPTLSLADVFQYAIAMNPTTKVTEAKLAANGTISAPTAISGTTTSAFISTTTGEWSGGTEPNIPTTADEGQDPELVAIP